MLVFSSNSSGSGVGNVTVYDLDLLAAATVGTTPGNLRVSDAIRLLSSAPPPPPPPARATTLPPTPISPTTTFLKSTWPMPTRIFDATTFGAVADDGLDDTDGIQGAIDAASKAGSGAMAYVRH